MTEVAQKIYISHSFSADLADIKAILPVGVISNVNLTPGTRIDNLLLKSIKECDLFIAVYDNNSNANMMFEAGIAFGLKKPIIIVYSSGNEYSFPKVDSCVAISRENTELLYVAITRLLAGRPSSDFEVLPSINNKKTSIPMPVNLLSKKFIDLIDNSGSSYSQVVYEPINSNRNWTPDFAMWIDSLNSAVGNPMLFEIKHTLNIEDAIKFRDKIKKATKNNRQDRLIVIYENGSDEKLLNEEVNSQGIIFTKFENLQSRVEQVGLSKAIIELYQRYYR